MSKTLKRTVSLPPEHSAFIDRMVADGTYGSASEVVRAGLRALRERNEAVERWLQEDVAAAYDRVKKDPARALPCDRAFDDVRKRHAQRLADES